MTQFDEDQIVASLLIKAETQGYVVTEDILELLPEGEDNYEQVEQVINLLEEAGVLVQDLVAQEEDEGEITGMDDSDDGEGEEDEEEEEDTPPAADDDLAGISVDDGIGLYLREMTRVPLLTNEEEVRLARAIERSRAAEARVKLRGDRLSPRERHQDREDHRRGTPSPRALDQSQHPPRRQHC